MAPIVSAGSPRLGTLRDSLQAYADRLAATGAFADVTARDARTVAAIVAWDMGIATSRPPFGS